MRKIIRHKKSRILTAFALIFCLLLTLSLLPKGVALAEGLNLEKTCTLTVNPGKSEGLQEVDVRIDLYKVADAVEIPNYDNIYGFQALGAYQSLQGTLNKWDTLDNAAWQALAQQAAELTLGSEGASIGSTREDIKAGAPISGLACGLYLVIARGEGVTDYVGRTSDGQLVTKAYSEDECYTYLPELVALPSTVKELNGQTVTTDGGEWTYDLTAILKPSQGSRYGTLDIVKRLTGYEENTPATFIFQVDVYNTQGGTLLDSNVVAIDFKNAGEKSLHIADRIPVGAYVVVTELYTGSFYRPQGDTIQAVVMEAEGAQVTFVNDYNENTPPGGGGSIVNHFFEGQNSSWNWEPMADNTAE